MNKEKEKNEIIKQDNVVLKRSNAFIEAKYNSTLLEKKMIALALTRVMLDGNKMIARLTVRDIKNALHIKGNGVYDQLVSISKSTMRHYLVLEDSRSEQRFDIISIIERAQYDDGVLTFTFNDEIKKHTIDVTKRFTLTSLSTLLSFKSNNTYRLYELLMINYFKIPDNGVFQLSYELAELRFLIGLVDTNREDVATALQKGRTYEYILEHIIKDYKYKDWSNFKARILEPAKKEMLESDLSEISFDYEPVRRSRGGRTEGITFYLRKQGRVQPPEKRIEIDDNEQIVELMRIGEGLIDNTSAESLLRAANNDMERLKVIINECKIRRGAISNPYGWMLRAVTEKWRFYPDKQKNTSTANNVVKNSFNDFPQRDTPDDFTQLLLNRTYAMYGEKAAENTDDQIEGQMSIEDYMKMQS